MKMIWYIIDIQKVIQMIAGMNMREESPGSIEQGAG